MDTYTAYITKVGAGCEARRFRFSRGAIHDFYNLLPVRHPMKKLHLKKLTVRLGKLLAKAVTQTKPWYGKRHQNDWQYQTPAFVFTADWVRVTKDRGYYTVIRIRPRRERKKPARRPTLSADVACLSIGMRRVRRLSQGELRIRETEIHRSWRDPGIIVS